MLLWTAVVALGCGMLSSVSSDALDWLVLPAWLVTVFVVRRVFGCKWAAITSAVLGMLLILGWTIYRPKLLGMIGLALGICVGGTVVGFIPFLLVEAACRAVDRIDSVGQTDE